MSATAEARAEAEKRWPQWRHLRDSWDAVAMQAAFRQGAEWQASGATADRDRYRAAIVEALAFEAALPAIATVPRNILSAALNGGTHE